MKKVNLAKKYAKALAESAMDDQEYGKIRSELEDFIGFVNSDQKVKAGIETMLFSNAQKQEILEIYSEKVKPGKKIYNFLKTLIDNNRMSYLEDIFECLQDQWYESRGVEKFVLFSAVELDNEQENRLKTRLKKALGREVVFEKEVDPSLLAGIKLMKGSVYYDFSIEGNLKKLRASLVGDESI